MKIIDASLQTRQIELAKPFYNASTSYLNRDIGYIKLVLKNIDGSIIESIGEVSPLVGFNTESLEEIKRDFGSKFKIKILNINTANIKNLNLPKVIPPSLRFGIESAIINYHSKKDKKEPCQVVSRAFFGCSCGDIEISSVRLLQLGQLETDFLNGSKVKIKLDGNSVKDSIKAYEKIFSFSPDSIRVDFNSTGSYQSIIEILREIESVGSLEFVEEPLDLKDTVAFAKLKSTFPNIKFAIDESIYQVGNLQAYIDAIKPDVVVIKPSAFGGISELLGFAAYLADRSINFYLSSLFETQVAIDIHTNIHKSLVSKYGELVLAPGLGARV